MRAATYRRCALGLLALALALTAAPAVAADADTTPPVLTSISFSTSGPYAPGTQVGYKWTAADASGIDKVIVNVADADGAIHKFEGGATADVRKTIDSSWSLGLAELDFIEVRDTSGNISFYNPGGELEFYPSGDVSTHSINFTALGFVVGASTTDGNPPVLSEFDFSPKSVDVTGGAKDVTVTARVTDATGAQAPSMALIVDDENNRQTLGVGPMTRISGDAKNGVYQRVVSIPTTAVRGTWTLRIDPLSDTGGNAETTPHVHPSKLTVSSGTTDVAAPLLSEFDFAPKTVDVTSGAKDVTVTARVTDATGAAPPTLVLDSDTSTQTLGAGAMTRTSGDAKNGVYTKTVSVPATAATGTWTVTIQPLVDTLGNAGPGPHHHPTKLTVTRGVVGDAPDAPSGVTAVGGNASAQVSWTAPADNGSPITGYTIITNPGGATLDVDAGMTSATVTGLTNGQAYTFTVTATNEHGTSPPSAPSPSVKPATVPGRVAKPKVVLKGGKVTLSWKTPTTGGAKITGYRIVLDGKATQVAAGKNRLVARALAPGRHKVKVAATNRVGTGPASPTVRFRVPR